MKWYEEASYMIIFVIVCIGGLLGVFWVNFHVERWSYDNIHMEKHKVVVTDEVYSSERNIGRVSTYHDAFYLRVKDSIGHEIILPSRECPTARKKDTLILLVEVSDVNKNGNKIFKIIKVKKYENKH